MLVLVLAASVALCAGIAGCRGNAPDDQASSPSEGQPGGLSAGSQAGNESQAGGQTGGVAGPQAGEMPVAVSRSDSGLRCGPFLRIGQIKPDPSGALLAVTDSGAAEMRLWVVDLVSQAAVCLLSVPKMNTANPALRRELHFFAWSPAGDDVYFGVAGRQAVGPYRDQVGWWVGSVPATGGEPSTVAFLPYEKDIANLEDGPGPGRVVQVAGDGSSILINDSLGLSGATIRVSLPGGERVEYQLHPSCSFDHLEVSYSPDGWWAYQSRSLFDLRNDKGVSLTPPCEYLMAWTPGGLALGWDTAREDLAAVMDGYSPVAATGFALYGADGSRAYELTAPGGGRNRVLNGAWSPDGKTTAFPVGVVEGGRFIAKELWVWTPETGESSKLTDLPEGAGMESWGCCLEIEWIEPSLIRLWLRATTLDWLDVEIMAGADGLTGIQRPRVQLPDCERACSYGDSVIVAEKTKVKGQPRSILLVGPRGQTLLAELSGNLEYQYGAFLPRRGRTLELAAPAPGQYLVLLQGYYSIDAPDAFYLNLVPLPGRP